MLKSATQPVNNSSNADGLKKNNALNQAVDSISGHCFIKFLIAILNFYQPLHQTSENNYKVKIRSLFIQIL